MTNRNLVPGLLVDGNLEGLESINVYSHSLI